MSYPLFCGGRSAASRACVDVCMEHETCWGLRWRLPHGHHSAGVLRGSAMKNIEDCTSSSSSLLLLSQNDKQTPRLQLGAVAEMGQHGRHLSGMWGDAVPGSPASSQAQLQRSGAQLAQEAEHLIQTHHHHHHRTSLSGTPTPPLPVALGAASHL